MKKLCVGVATGGGLGRAPIAPGTWGTLLGVPIAFGLLQLPEVYRLPLWMVLGMLGLLAAQEAESTFGVKDPSAIVVDEYIAFAGLLLFVPMGALPWTWAFLGFRLFDIWKPFPLSWVDRHVFGGLGIMLDDVLAAILAYGAWRLLSMWGLS